MKTAAVLMASGRSRRFGENKLLAPIDGAPMVSYAINAAKGAGFSKLLLLSVHKEVTDYALSLGIDAHLHSLPDRNEAVALAVSLLTEDTMPDAILFLPCDQPGITISSLQNMQKASEQNPDAICRLSYDTRMGAPVLFPARFFEALQTLPPKCGGSYLIQKYPEAVLPVYASSPRELFDIDTREDMDTYFTFT